MVEIKRDLKSTVGDVNSVAEALKHLQGVATSLFGVLGNLTETFGNQVGRAANTAASAGAGPPRFFTERGVEVREELARHLAEASERDFQAAVKLRDEPSSPNIVLKEGHGIEVAGASVRSVPRDPLERRKMFEAAHKASLGDVPESEIVPHLKNLGIGVIEKKTEVQPTHIGPRDLSGIGYSVSDLARVNREVESFRGEKEQGDIVSAIKKLSERSDDTSKTLAITLKQLQQTVAENSTKLAEATRAYKEVMEDAQATPQQKEAARQNLLSTMGSFEKSAEEARNIVKFSDGDGGGEGGGFRDKLIALRNRYAGMAGGAFGATAAGVMAYHQVGSALDRATYGKELQEAKSASNLEAMRFQASLGSRDMTRPENILKYAGDFLLPDRDVRFLGRKGLANAEAVSAEMTKMRMDMLKLERDKAMTSSALKAVGQVGQIAAGVVFGGPIGIGMAAQGVSGLADTMSGATGAYVESPYTAATGGLEGGVLGLFGAHRRERYPELARHARHAAFLNQQVEASKTVEELREDELQFFKPELSALEDIQAMRDAQKKSAELVGGYAMSVRQVMDYYAGRSEPSKEMSRIVSEREKLAAKTAEYVDTGRQVLSAKAQETQARLAAPVSGPIAAEDMAKRARAFFAAADPEAKDNLFSAMAAETEAASRRSLWQKIWNVETPEMRDAKAARESAQGVVRDSVVSPLATPEKEIRLEKKYLLESAYNSVSDLRRAIAAGSIDLTDQQPGFAATTSEEHFHRRVAEYEREIKELRQDPAIAIYGRINQYSANQLAYDMATRGVDATRTSLLAGRALPLEGMDQSLRRPKGGEPLAPEDSTEVDGYLTRGAKQAKEAERRAEKNLSMFAALEMSPAEFMMSHAQVTNVMGSRRVGTAYQKDSLFAGELRGQSATWGQTADLIRLGRSGLGSFEQHVQAIGSLNRVAGGTGSDNLENLKKVLTEAVSQGFDKSRTSQQFVSATLSVMASTGQTDAGTASRALAGTSLLLGLGTPDERNLEEARRGQEALGAWTSRTTGVMGTLQAVSALGAGYGLSSGFSTAISTSIQQNKALLRELESGKSTEKLSRDARDRVVQESLDLSDKERRESAAAKVRQMYEGQKRTLDTVINKSGAGVKGGFEEVTSRLQGLKGADRQRYLEHITSKIKSSGVSIEGLEGEGAVAAFQTFMEDRGLLTAADRKVLNTTVAKGQGAWSDTARQNVRAVKDKWLADFSVSMAAPVSGEEYKQYLSYGGRPVPLPGGKGFVTPQMLEGGAGGEQKEMAEKALKDAGVNRLELVRSAEIAAAGGPSAVQSVRVINMSDFETIFRRTGKIPQSSVSDSTVRQGSDEPG